MKIIFTFIFMFIFNLQAETIENAKLKLTIVDLIPNSNNITFQKIIRKNYNLIERPLFEKYGKDISIKELNFNLTKNIKSKNRDVSVFLGESRALGLTNLVIYDKIEKDGIYEKIRYVLDIEPNKYYYYEINYNIKDKEYKRIYQFEVKKVNLNIFSF